MTKLFAEAVVRLLSSGPSIGCALALPIIKVSKKKSDKPITARVNANSEQLAFGCTRAVPTSKE